MALHIVVVSYRWCADKTNVIYKTNYELHNHTQRKQICKTREKTEQIITWSQSETCAANP